MKGLKTGVLVALTLTVALATASPAYATVAFTDSQANASPWWNPIGDTIQSSVTGFAANLSFVVPGAGAVTCMVRFSGYVPQTHTQMRITNVQFRNCTSDMGTVSGVGSPVNSQTPWLLHLTTFLFPPSATGTLNIPAVSPISIVRTWMGMQCDITIPAQSIRFTWTNPTTSLVFNDPT
ncbi:MAG TPA: hypothetical protein VI111_00535, partial [Thermoleophilaceae bacterium]